MHGPLIPADSDGSFTGRGRPTLVASYSATTDTGPVANGRPFNYWLTDSSCTTASPLGCE